MSGVRFYGSRAKYGGAIYTEGSKMEVSLHGGTFQNCSAEGPESLGNELKRSSGKFSCLGKFNGGSLKATSLP